jgi:hypothetical protein
MEEMKNAYKIWSENLKGFSLHHRVKNGSEAHSVSYPVGTRGFPWG